MIKEMIVDLLCEKLGKIPMIEVAQAILNLRYPCKECGGKGYVDYPHEFSDKRCPTCKGTGKGEKILYTLDEMTEWRKQQWQSAQGSVKERSK